MKIILNILLIFSISIVHAQNYILNYSQIDSIADYGIGKGIAANSLGEYYVTGESMLTSLYNGQPLNIISGNKEDGIILSKFTEDGDMLWSVFEQNLSISSINRVNSIALDSQENIIIGGFFEYGLSFENESINNALGSNENPFVAKFAPNGSLIWLQRVHTTGNSSMGRITSVSTDSYGNIYFGGFFAGTMTFGGHTIQNMDYSDNFWGKMDSGGNVLWVNAAGSDNIEWGVGIIADSIGNLYVNGNVAGHPMPNYVGDSLNIKGAGFITKYSTDGQMQWLKTAEKGWFYPSNHHETMINEKNGKVVLTGYMKPENDTLQIAGLELVSTLTSVSDMIGYAMMLDENGNGIWLTEVIKSYSRGSQGIDFESNGDVFVLINTYGGFLKHIDSIVTSGFGTSHFFTLDGTNGQVIDYFYPSHPNYSTPVSGTSIGATSLFIKNDTILTTGIYANELNGLPRLFIGKYFPDVLSIEDPLEQFVKIYPNPFEERFFIEDYEQVIKEIKIFDNTGKLIKVISNPNQLQEIYTNFPSGVYHINIKTKNGQIMNRKVIRK